MAINDLFDGAMKSVNQFAEGRSRTSCALQHSDIPVHQVAKQRLQETGRGPENAESFEAKEKRGITIFRKGRDYDGSTGTLKAKYVVDNAGKTRPITGRGW